MATRRPSAAPSNALFSLQLQTCGCWRMLRRGGVRAAPAHCHPRRECAQSAVHGCGQHAPVWPGHSEAAVAIMRPYGNALHATVLLRGRRAEWSRMALPLFLALRWACQCERVGACEPLRALMERAPMGSALLRQRCDPRECTLAVGWRMLDEHRGAFNTHATTLSPRRQAYRSPTHPTHSLAFESRAKPCSLQCSAALSCAQPVRVHASSILIGQMHAEGGYRPLPAALHHSRNSQPQQ